MPDYERSNKMPNGSSIVISSKEGEAPRRMSLRRSLSFKKHAAGAKEKSSLFASFTTKTSLNKLPVNSLHPTRSFLPGAAEGKIKANLSSDSLDKLTDHEDVISPTCSGVSDAHQDQKQVDLSALGADEMARLLEYDSQEDDYEQGLAYDSPGGESPHAVDEFSRDGANCHRRSSTGTSFDEESLGGLGGEIDSVTLLKDLGDDATESEMAKVALARAQESIDGCFSVGVDRVKFYEIPCYTRGELLMGRHLGKGSFSDVFEVTATVQNQVPLPDLNKFKTDAPNQTIPDTDGRRRPSQRRHSMSSSVCVGSLGRPQVETVPQGKRLTLAMKCLRPQARSNFEHFLIGVEDLIHETAILSSLDHPNIIKIWGRAGGDTSFKLSDGYFILVDRLRDTLQDKIDRWAKAYPNSRKNAPALNQVKVACDLSNALSYLHMSNIVFRDLKPANVGFDSKGVLKLFDFGFATSIAPSSNEAGDCDAHHQPQILQGKCGTLRYMAPEVGLSQGYGKEVDVYSFGILLWEICAARKPFSAIKSADEFENKVFLKGDRPKLGKYWPEDLKDLMEKSWSTVPSERPTMPFLKSILTAHVHDLKSGSNQKLDCKKSIVMTKRLTWNI